MNKSKAILALIDTVAFTRGLIGDMGREGKLIAPQGSYAGQLEEAYRRLDANLALVTTSEPDDAYQGWSNRETWTVNLWIGNDERLYNHARGIALEYGTTVQKADQLATYMARAGNKLDGFLADMHNAAMARVDWVEIIKCLGEA